MTCPLIGRISDKVGRKVCLLVTVAGTTAPVCILAFTFDMRVYAAAQGEHAAAPPRMLKPSHLAISSLSPHFCFLAFDVPSTRLSALSGVFSGTFTLTFAYIADTVEPRDRAPAYGLALACLGLSFTIGPITGSYISAAFGTRAVFGCSLLLALVDLVYIVLVLPESNAPSVKLEAAARLQRSFGGKNNAAAFEMKDVIPSSYNPMDALEIFAGDPLLSQVARVTFLYYIGVWAVVTLHPSTKQDRSVVH